MASGRCRFELWGVWRKNWLGQMLQSGIPQTWQVWGRRKRYFWFCIAANDLYNLWLGLMVCCTKKPWWHWFLHHTTQPLTNDWMEKCMQFTHQKKHVEGFQQVEAGAEIMVMETWSLLICPNSDSRCCGIIPNRIGFFWWCRLATWNHTMPQNMGQCQSWRTMGSGDWNVI